MVLSTASSRSTSADLVVSRNNSSFYRLQVDDWLILFGLLGIATFVRLMFFNGVFGSDDLIYLERSVEISKGIWSSANYNGSLRYGFNIPAGIFIRLFGISELSAIIWLLLCSLIEIAIAYVLASKLWGRQSGICAALILLSMPLHIASATRIHADAIVSCFLTLSFAIFYWADLSRNSILYFLAGIAMGMVFWAKELAVVALFGLALYPVIRKRLDARWGYVVLGGLIMLFAHLILMSLIAGDPFHLFKVVTGQIGRSFIGSGDGEDAAWYYFRYLFFDIRQTWLGPFFAVAAMFALIRHRLSVSSVTEGAPYVAFWLLSTLAVLSFLPVSLDPLRLVMKQSNYLTLFLSPFALLAGYWLGGCSRRVAVSLVAAAVSGGLLLGAMEQAAYRVFTSNSKAAVSFARSHTDSYIVGSVNNANIARIYSVLDQNPALVEQVGDFDDPPNFKQHADGITRSSYALLDLETIGWGGDDERLSPSPHCWSEVTRLTPDAIVASAVIIRAALSVLEFL